MTCIVFAGPTLTPPTLHAICPDAAAHPPVGQGDIVRAVAAGATTLAIVDGVFLDRPAVWHREILHALAHGVRVLGAASMGALRACELATFGMEGVGIVFGAYRDGALPGWDEPFEDDDEVAIVHAPAALGHAPLSDAMVDLRITLAAAERAGQLGRARRDAVAARLKALHFPHRSLATLQAMLAETDPEAAAWVARHHRSQKTADALALLHHLATPPPPAPAFVMQQALVWTHALARLSVPALSPADRARLDALRADPAAWRRLAAAALGRAALAARTEPPPGPAPLGPFRLRRDLLTHAALVDWARARGLDSPALARLAHHEAALDAALDAADPAMLEHAVLDLLHLEYAVLDLLHLEHAVLDLVHLEQAP